MTPPACGLDHFLFDTDASPATFLRDTVDHRYFDKLPSAARKMASKFSRPTD